MEGALIIRVLLIWLFLMPCVSFANEAYLNSAEKEFEALLELLPKNEKDEWKHRDFNEVMNYSNKLEELKKSQDYIKKNTNSKDMEGVLAFSFLADANRFKLESKTTLVNGLGQYIYNLFKSNRIEPVKKAIELELLSLQNANGALQLQSQLSKYFAIQRKLEERSQSPPILMSYEFRPQHNAWDSDPSLVKKFVLYDWISAINSLKKDLADLHEVKDSFVSFNYLRLKDPIAFVSLGCQLAVLLVTVAGYLISYTRQPSIVVVASLVVLSMLVSIVLVFVSSSTSLNLALQAIVPALFIGYWVYQNSHNKAFERDSKKLV